MRYSAYLSGPIPDVAPHKLSRDLAVAAERYGLVRKIGQNAVQIVNGMSIRELKDYLRGTSRHFNSVDDSGTLNPPGYHVLPYTYPLPYHLLRSYER